MTFSDAIIPHENRELIFKKAIQSSKSEFILTSPFISSYGVAFLGKYLPCVGEITMLTKLSVRDAINGVSDPISILDFLVKRDAESSVRVLINQKLHAKAIVSDKRLAIFGSSNFTKGGLKNNWEINYTLVDEQAKVFAAHLKNDLLDFSQSITLDELHEWVTQYNELNISRESTVNEIQEAQDQLDESLTFVPEAGLRHEPEISDFWSWLQGNNHLLGAKTFLKHLNGYDNRSGHARLSFFASYRFFEENSKYIDRFIKLLDLPSKSYADFPDDDFDLISPFKSFLKQNRSLRHLGFDLGNLVRNLGSKWGGSRSGGGGAAGSLARALPLVAKWLRDG